MLFLSISIVYVISPSFPRGIILNDLSLLGHAVLCGQRWQFYLTKTQLLLETLFRNYESKWPLQRHYKHITALFSCYPATENDKSTLPI